MSQKWVDMKGFYCTLKRNITVLYARGFSYMKILRHSDVETIFLCAVFFMLNLHDSTAAEMVSLFDETKRLKYDKYVEIFRMIEGEEYSSRLKMETRLDKITKQEENEGVEKKLQQKLEPKEEVAREDMSEEGTSKQNEVQSSRKRVRSGEGEDVGSLKDREYPNALVKTNKTPSDSEARPAVKRARLGHDHDREYDDSRNLEKIFSLVSELQLSINDYKLMLLEYEKLDSEAQTLGRQFITDELSYSLKRSREYEDSAVKEQLKRDGGVAEMHTRLYGDIERFRFKRYELETRRNHVNADKSAVAIAGTPLTADETEQQLAQRIETVQTIIDTSNGRPDSVSKTTLDRALMAGVFVSRRCEEYLTSILARATELCVASSDATQAVRERLLQLEEEEERDQNGPAQEGTETGGEK